MAHSPETDVYKKHVKVYRLGDTHYCVTQQ